MTSRDDEIADRLMALLDVGLNSLKKGDAVMACMVLKECVESAKSLDTKDRVFEDREAFYAVVAGRRFGPWANRGAALAGLATEQRRLAIQQKE